MSVNFLAGGESAMKEVRGWWAGHCILLAADCGYLYVGEYALRWVSGWWALYNGQPILSQNKILYAKCFILQIRF